MLPAPRPRWKRGFAFALVFGSIAAGSAPAGEAGVACTDYSKLLAEVGRLDVSYGASDVAVAGSWAFLAKDRGRVHVVDVSDPQSPAIVTTVQLPSEPAAIELYGAYAFVADNGSGLQVLYVSDPRSPRIAAALSLPGGAGRLALEGATLYVSTSAEFHVVDVSNPTAPRLAGSSSRPYSYHRGLAIYASHAYVTQEDSVAIFDVSSPEAPRIVRAMPLNGHAAALAVRGHELLVGTWGRGYSTSGEL